MPLPTRVIDVGDEERDPILLEGQGAERPILCAFVLLGQHYVFLKLLAEQRANLASHRKRNPFHNLPSTLQDASRWRAACGFLSISGSMLSALSTDDSEDLGREASRMQDIYASASLTSYQARGFEEAADDGLFRPRRTRNSTAICLNYRVPKSFRGYARAGGEHQPAAS